MNLIIYVRMYKKNASGKWQVTYIYPRIGNKKSNLSNISTEGRIEDFHEFLMNEYGDKQGKKYAEDILKLSIDVAWNLDKLYGMAIDELGLDFAIDDKGKIWMHEANNGPQTAFHEDQRAVNTIGYAKYIYKNGIVHSLSANSIQKNQFNSHTSNLSTRHHMGKKIIRSYRSKYCADYTFTKSTYKLCRNGKYRYLSYPAKRYRF